MRWIDAVQPSLQGQAIDSQLRRRLTITFVGFYFVPTQRIQNVFRSHRIAAFSSHVSSLSIQAKFHTVLIQRSVSNPSVIGSSAFRCGRCLFENEQRNLGSNRSVARFMVTGLLNYQERKVQIGRQHHPSQKARILRSLTIEACRFQS